MSPRIYVISCCCYFSVRILKLLEKCQNIITLPVFVAVGKFVCDVNGGRPVRSFFVYV